MAAELSRGRLLDLDASAVAETMHSHIFYAQRIAPSTLADSAVAWENPQEVEKFTLFVKGFEFATRVFTSWRVLTLG